MCLEVVDRAKFSFLAFRRFIAEKKSVKTHRKILNLWPQVEARAYEYKCVHFISCFFYK
jgi:hypothetical protein